MPQCQLPRETHLDGYRTLRLLGEGGEGPTWLCERRSDKKLVALKSYDVWTKSDGTPREIYILQYVVPNHPRILYCDGWSELDNGGLDVYYDYCKGGDLARLTSRRQPYDESFIWHVFMQIADALAFLHYGYRRDRPHTIPTHWQHVVHRDVKPENIFFRKPFSSSRDLPPLVLGDFGIATLHPTTEAAGTPYWHGPEWPLVTAKSDIWGLGAVIHTLAHGYAPYNPTPPAIKAGGEEAMRAWIRDPRSKGAKALTTDYSEELNRNMLDSLRLDYRDRVDSKSLVQNLVRDRELWRRRRRGR